MEILGGKHLQGTNLTGLIGFSEILSLFLREILRAICFSFGQKHLENKGADLRKGI